MRFLILLLVFVYIEVSLAGLVVEHVGLLNTIGLMILSAFFGVFLIRRQGFLALEKIKLSLAQGKTPTDDIVGGVFLVLAGFLFIFPGFFSDILGFILLFPWFRKAVISFVKPRLGSSGTWFSRTVVYSRDGGWQSSETLGKPGTSRDSTIGGESSKTFDGNPAHVIIDCTPDDPDFTSARASQDKDESHGAESAVDADAPGDASTDAVYDVSAEKPEHREDHADEGKCAATGEQNRSGTYDCNPKV